jgi:ABC-type transport system involved in cytochrome c biogenesis permease subunit
MATSSVQDWNTADRGSAGTGDAVTAAVWRTCQVLGSLKMTVVLFALSMVIVLVGTLAQEDLNMVEVKQRYFTSWIAQMRLEDFVPQAFVRHDPMQFTFPFPGGALVGVLLLVNLIAAKVTRFHLRAKGGRLLGGLAIFAFGCLLCYFVVAAGHSSDGVQGQPPVSYQTLWGAMVAGMAVLWLSGVYKAFTSQRKGWRYIWGALAIAFGILGGAALTGYFEMSVSSLRITWQLLQGTVVALVMLVGSLILFEKQGGNLLLHFGVAFLMVGQFAFGDTQLEQRLSLVEGQSTNEFLMFDAVELVFIDRRDPANEQVTAVPEAKLQRLAETGEILADPRLPVDIRVLKFFDNSKLTAAEGENLATVGNGLEFEAVGDKPSGGVSSAVDFASAYVELFDRESGDSLGTRLVSQQINDFKLLTDGRNPDSFDQIAVGDQEFDLGLRFVRVPKPYWVKVKDVRRITYSGTETPRDYSSFLKLVDPATGEVRDERVWMNNPLRYRGETFYQSDYRQLPGGKEFTSIQVVQNSGWMIPYIACMIVAVGMIYHFSGTLDRFLGRQERAAGKSSSGKLAASGSDSREHPYAAPLGVSKADAAEPAPTGPSPQRSNSWVLATAVGVTIALLSIAASIPWGHVMMTMRPESQKTSLNLYRAGELPVRFGGRVIPLDAYARRALTAISNRESLALRANSETELPPAPREIVQRAGDARSLSAMQWLLEVASGKPAIRDLHMFRIDADEVLNHFELDRRKSKLYSLAELIPKFDSFDKELQLAKGKDESELTFKDSKMMELASRISEFQQVETAFNEPAIPRLPPEFAQMELTPEQVRQAQFMMLDRQMQELERAPIAALIPPTADTSAANVDYPPWLPFPVARYQNIRRSVSGEDEFVGTDTFAQMVEAYGEQDSELFNKAVDDHLAAVASVAPRDYRATAVEVERWIEAVRPTLTSRIFYGLLLVIGLFALLLSSNRLRVGVWGGLIGVVLLHSVFLLARSYVTGRAPVINLYSSAVFIGWAGVISGLILEGVYRRGIGNLIAAGSGISSLMVAWALDTGDTMPVLQAVLDTQFWLSTHVITVTLGYAATFVAGGLGILFLAILLLNKRDQELRRDIYRMAYSATCFGILFSFVGTVLGGLWADDSWGRFWGWDPKENGALLIVIWNALMLHARWDGMVKDRGFALLAVVGNIVTAWSWFGTNQLGLGLHAYGGNSGAKMWLGIFVASQLLVLALGLLVTRSGRARTES